MSSNELMRDPTGLGRPGTHTFACHRMECIGECCDYKSTIGRFIVSPMRDVIVDRRGFFPVRFAFGPNASHQGPDVTRVTPPHRREYTEADAVAVCEYLNQRVTP